MLSRIASFLNLESIVYSLGIAGVGNSTLMTYDVSKGYP